MSCYGQVCRRRLVTGTPQANPVISGLRTHSVQLLHLQKRSPDGAVPNMCGEAPDGSRDKTKTRDTHAQCKPRAHIFSRCG